MDGAIFSVGDVIAGSVALGCAFGWIEWRLRGVSTLMDQHKDELAKARDGAITKERDERIGAIRAATAENQAATARLERQIAQTNKDIADMKLGMLRDLRDYPTKDDLETMVVDRLDKLEQRIERAIVGRGGGRS